MANKRFTLKQITKQIDTLSTRLKEQSLRLDAGEQPKTLDDYHQLQAQVDELSNSLSHLRRDFNQSVEEPVKQSGNELITSLMLKATPEQLVQLQQELRSMNGQGNGLDKSDNDQVIQVDSSQDSQVDYNDNQNNNPQF